MKRSHKVAVAVVVTLVAGAVGGGVVFRSQDPVTLDEAIDRFRDATEGRAAKRRTVARVEVDRDGRSNKPPRATPTEKTGPASGPTPAQPEASSGRSRATREQARTRSSESSGVLIVSAPAEGVYTYDGAGKEGLGPFTREFPETSQRVITRKDGNTWIEHHLFSQERQAWSKISTTAAQRVAHYQRNYVKIGPREEDETLLFVPPIPTAVLPPEVGHTWSGERDGQTRDGDDFRATYECQTFEEKVWDVGGTKVRVWGVLLEMELDGDISGTVTIRRWFSPRYGLNVREIYYADVDLGPVTYHAEWSVTLRSLVPET